MVRITTSQELFYFAPECITSCSKGCPIGKHSFEWIVPQCSKSLCCLENMTSLKECLLMRKNDKLTRSDTVEIDTNVRSRMVRNLLLTSGREVNAFGGIPDLSEPLTSSTGCSRELSEIEVLHMNALIESMYIFLYDFEQQVVLKAIDPSFSLDELKLANRPDVESISNVSNAPSGLARMGLLITTNPQGVSAPLVPVVCLADATINHGLLCPRLLNPCSSRDSLSVIGAASPMAVSGGFSMCSNGIEIGGIHSQRACRMKESGWTGSVACGEVSEDLFKQHAAYESQKSRQTFKDRLGTLYCIVLFSVSLTGHNSSDRNKPSSLFSRNIAPQPIALVGIADKSFATFVIGMEKMSSSLPFELAISNTNISDNKAATVIGNYDSLVTEEVSVAFLLDMVTGDLYQVIKSRGKFQGNDDSSHNYRFVLHTAENYEVLHVNAQTIPPLRNGDDKTFQICGSTTIASPNQVSLHLSYTLSTVGDSSAGKSPRSTHRSLLANRQVTTQPITDAGEARVRIVVRGRDMHNLVFPCTRSSFMQLVPMCQIYTQNCVVEML